eukprot:gene9427-10414_t
MNPKTSASIAMKKPKRHRKNDELSRETRSTTSALEKLEINGKICSKPRSSHDRQQNTGPGRNVKPFANKRTVGQPGVKLKIGKGQRRMISPRLRKQDPTNSNFRPVVVAGGRTSRVSLGTGKELIPAVGRHGNEEKNSTASSALNNTALITAKTKKPGSHNAVSKPRGSCNNRAIVSQRSYTVKPIIPAKTAELLDVARAMHRDQFAGRVKKLFDPEREAAFQAIESGIYIGWRCLGNDYDCIRVSTNSKCFCGHLQAEHDSFVETRKQALKCKLCACKQFAFIPSRPAEIGEWWLQKRPGFDVRSWRAKCRCKHTHEEHDPNGRRKCRSCSCFAFDSNFLCAACDKHWEEHDTCFDDVTSRRMKNLSYGEEYLPFHELPQLRNIVLTGNEDDDSPYNALVSGSYAIPRQRPTDLALKLQGNNGK